MTNEKKREHAHYVNRTFVQIAPHYDLMNRLMSGGADLLWRREVIRLADLQPGETLLDLGSGTGDLAREARKHAYGTTIIAADFTLEMLLQKNDWTGIPRCNSDALMLPFQDCQFDTIISGFLMRNVGDVDRALQEQYRLLKPGGKLVILDTTRPRKSLLLPLVRLYLKYVIPFLGTLLTRNKEAYTYLPESTRNFFCAEDLAKIIEENRFTNISFKIRSFGTVAIHQATKST